MPLNGISGWILHLGASGKWRPTVANDCVQLFSSNRNFWKPGRSSESESKRSEKDICNACLGDRLQLERQASGAIE